MSENIVYKSETRTYEQLTQKEKKQVETQLSSLDYMNQNSINQFCSDSSKDITQILAQIISKLKGMDFEDVFLLINNAVNDLKTVNPSKLIEQKEERGLPRKKKRYITEFLTKQIQLEKEIDEIEEKLLHTKMSLEEDIYFYSILIQKLFETAKKQEVYYITIQETIKKLEAKKQQLDELYKQAPNNVEYSYRISEIGRAIEKLKSKAHQMLLVRKSTLKFVSHMSLLQRGDEIMVFRIEDAIYNIISFWKKNFYIALEVYRLNNAAVISSLITDKTNKLLEQNSQILKNTILRMTTQKEIEAINSKTLCEANKNLQQTFNDLKSLNEEVERIREKAINEIKDIQALAQQLEIGINMEQLEDKNE